MTRNIEQVFVLPLSRIHTFRGCDLALGCVHGIAYRELSCIVHVRTGLMTTP
jgi:hypothetical protein